MLWKHQTEAIHRASLVRDYALFMEQGTGKTRTMIEILLKHRDNYSRCLHTLILCPAIVVDNWPKEIDKFSDFTKVIKLQGPGSKRLDALKRARDKWPTGFIAITNYEALTSIAGMPEALCDWSPEVIVFDESQRIKTYNSKRTKAAHILARGAKHRYLLSGTPILNSPMDLWAQCKAMDLGNSFGDNFFSFRAKFFYDKNAGMNKSNYFPDWRVRTGAYDEFQDRVSRISSVVKKSECLDLPPLVRQVIEVELSKSQRKHYEDMKNSLITFLGESACTAQLAITKALRLQQIVSGHMTMDDDEKTVEQIEDNPRAVALKYTLETILEDPTHKVLVWACWKADYGVVRRVCEELRVNYVEVHGDKTTIERARAVENFQNDTNVRVYLGHPGSGGIGINLVEASYMIYYSRNFSLENDLQSEARNYRAGSERHVSVTRIDLVATNTIDVEIQKALANKQEISDKVLRSLITT